MPTQKNIRDIASDIARTRLPAMVIDTCVSFDIIRCVCHDDVRVIGITQQLIDAHRNGELLLGGNDNTGGEWWIKGITKGKYLISLKYRCHPDDFPSQAMETTLRFREKPWYGELATKPMEFEIK